MFKNIKLMLIILIGTFLLSGCGINKIETNNPLNQKEVISYVQEQIYNETGDNVIVRIISKDDLYVCTKKLIDASCIHRKKIKDGHSYKLEITNKDNIDIIANAIYNDSYILYDDKYTDGRVIVEHYFWNNYKSIKGNNLVTKEFLNILNEKFDKHYLYENNKNDSTHNIFINSSNYDDINSLLLSLKDIIIKYREYTYSYYNIYIYKDENIFKNINFNTYKKFNNKKGKYFLEKATGKKVKRIGGSHNGFDYDLFITNGASNSKTNGEYIDYDTFDYIVFWFRAESNSFIGANNPELQIFGLK